jgi:hypothetical protein
MIAELEVLRVNILDLGQDAFTSSYAAELLATYHVRMQTWVMKGVGKHSCDPRDLIHDAYRIEGIAMEECRAIFFDWAIGLEAGVDPVLAAKTLHTDLAAKNPDHPMTALLAEASLGGKPKSGRKGRRRVRSG